MHLFPQLCVRAATGIIQQAAPGGRTYLCSSRLEFGYFILRDVAGLQSPLFAPGTIWTLRGGDYYVPVLLDNSTNGYGARHVYVRTGRGEESVSGFHVSTLRAASAPSAPGGRQGFRVDFCIGVTTMDLGGRGGWAAALRLGCRLKRRRTATQRS